MNITAAIIFIIVYVLILGFRIEHLHGKVDNLTYSLKNLIENGIVQEDKFEVNYELTEEEVKKIIRIVLKEIKNND